MAGGNVAGEAGAGQGPQGRRALLLDELDARRGLSGTARACLAALLEGIAAPPFEPCITRRGYFGDVLRWRREERPWLDALPARDWVLFYFARAALQVSGFHFAAISAAFPEAVERDDGIVKIRLRDRARAEAMAAFVTARLARP
ncbi:MAG: hypothetical protein Kow0058_08590 [Roseovarius sp.]